MIRTAREVIQAFLLALRRRRLRMERRRARFEQWGRRQGLDMQRARTNFTGYHWLKTQTAWESWQAGAVAERREVAIELLEDG